MLVVWINDLLSLGCSISCPYLPSDPDHSASGKQLVDNIECLNLRLPCINVVPRSSNSHFALTRVNEVFIELGWGSPSLLPSTNTGYRVLDSVLHWKLPSRRPRLTGQCIIAFFVIANALLPTRIAVQQRQFACFLCLLCVTRTHEINGQN
jgi:hypothetical protein